jgi:biotin carboxylase
MSKVLLVDTSIASAPIYNYLNEAGHQVHVVGGNPQDYLARVTDHYHELDYSKIEQFRAFVERECFEYIVPGCNDVSYRVCAAVNTDAAYPGIDSPENVEILNDKQKYREFASSTGLSVPRTYTLTEALSLSVAVIVKPVDAFSGKGITIVHNPQCAIELEAGIALAKHASPTGRFVIEQFVAGQLHSHTAFLAAGHVVMDFFVEEHCTANPYAVDTSRVIDLFPEGLGAVLRSAVEKTADLLKLENGLMHTQFLLSRNEVWLIEPTRRCPGDLYSNLIELSTGINYAENYARPFLGLPYSFSTDSSVKKMIMRHTITASLGGRLTPIRFNLDLQIKEIVNMMIAGETVKPAPASRVAIMFATANSVQEFNTIYRSALERKLYNCVV